MTQIVSFHKHKMSYVKVNESDHPVFNHLHDSGIDLAGKLRSGQNSQLLQKTWERFCPWSAARIS